MSRNVLIALISALVMLGPFTNNIMVPSLPSVASGLQATFSGAQLILSVFMVGFAAGQVFVFPNGRVGSITPYPKMAGAAASMLSYLQMSFAAILGAVAAGFLNGTVMPLAWTVFWIGPVMLFLFYQLVLRRPKAVRRD
tara:strand:+ start:334 stop:750 length:417 start_codon:yes stop_codon:yes gene_type:complete